VTPLGQQKLNSNKQEFINSIDSLFLKLELAYHYQFYKVFGTDERLNEGKKLWALSLRKLLSSNNYSSSRKCSWISILSPNSY
jgi:hypothetical protein